MPKKTSSSARASKPAAKARATGRAAARKPKTTATKRAATRSTSKRSATTRTAAKTTTARKRSATKTTTKRAATRRTPTPKPQPAAKPNPNPTVTLPNRMSIRAREKALVWAEQCERDFYHTARLLASVAGVCFVLIGGTATLSLLAQQSFINTEPVCAGGTCAAQVAGAELQPETSSLSLTQLTQLPSSLRGVFEYVFAVEASLASYSAELVAADGGLISLPIEALDNKKYRIVIDASKLPPTTFKLRLVLQPKQSSNFTSYTVGTVAVGQGPADAVPAASTTPTVLEADRYVEPAALQTVSFTIAAPAVATGATTLTAQFAGTVQEVTFFARPLHSTAPQLLGRTGEKTLTFDSRNLPNGTYKVFAKVLAAGSLYTSAATEMTVSNTRTISAARPRLSDRPTAPVRYNPIDPDRDTNAPALDVESVIADRVQNQLAADRDTLDALLQAYASALQSGDEVLQTRATQALASYRAALVASAMTDEQDRFIADELDAALAAAIAELQDSVQQFETIRATRTEADSQIDTDQDGIPDIDEQLIYNTDPNAADTDQDGITDGIEIVDGYDPLDPEPEAVITYQSPKALAVPTVTEKLSVTTVTPNIVLPTASSSEQVEAVVRGQALPHSFVTLYIFSTPTIVTVRTNDTGAFEYTFTHDLADGEHEVYAALTNNTGEIVAQSKPFTFIKEAQAFTPVDTTQAPGQSLTFTEATTDTTSYTLALTMAVLALGVLLLLLGVGLRANEPDIIVATS